MFEFQHLGEVPPPQPLGKDSLQTMGIKQCCVFLKLRARNMLASVEVSVTRQTWYHYGTVSWNQVKPHGLWGAEATLDFRSNWSLKTPIWGTSEVLWRCALMCSHGRYATSRHRDQSESLLVCKVPLFQEGGAGLNFTIYFEFI